MSPYQEALEVAEKYNKTLLATDPRFNRTTIIQHEDGSHFLFMNAFACSYQAKPHPTLGEQNFILVFTEHHGIHVYDKDEVAVRSIGDERNGHKILPLEQGPRDAGFWIPCYERGPTEKDFDLQRSENLLVTDGTNTYVAYAQFYYETWEADEPSYYEWFIVGPDSYKCEPTHWRPIPKLPEKK